MAPKKSSRKKSQKLSPKTFFWIIIALVVLGLGTYFIRVYKESGIEEEGIVVCQDNICEKSLHIHATITGSVCGKELDFDRHEGDTNEQHTHDDDDRMHFHNRLKVDPLTEEITDASPLYLGNFFNNLDIPFTSQCFGDKCNGDVCPSGKRGQVHLTVNGEDNSLLDKYPWKEGDDIRVYFD